MPKKLFYELDDEKRARIIRAALSEFAQYSYNESSTNRIVKHAGIGKGSLFKYFQNKKDLYFYILDAITADLTADLAGEMTNLKGDLFDRTIRYAELEFAWYMQNPEKYRLFKKAFVKNDTEIFKETEQRYALEGNEVFYRLFEDVDTREKEKFLDILKWFLQGFNEAFMEEMRTQDNINEVKDAYLKRLNAYMAILKEGLK
jgi:TetR/AcrR family transcriptional regulator